LPSIPSYNTFAFGLELQPLLNKTDEIQITEPARYESFGFIAITIYWRDMLTNLLPPGSDGIVIVFENECNPAFSFQVNGPDVNYLGRGDFHNHRYEAMEIGVSERLERGPLLETCSDVVF
jgi:hypothetical protein